jgi:uncharacterized repeat protein (TIGR03803 family)
MYTLVARPDSPPAALGPFNQEEFMRARALSSLRLILATFTVLSICADGAFAAKEKLLHSFNPAITYGSLPESTLVSDPSGNLYGTTYDGGIYSHGTVYKLSPNSKGGWTQTVLYSFQGSSLGGSDGVGPAASLVLDAQGNLYGTTTAGGTGSCGCGTVFKLAPGSGGGWTESALYSFQGGSDGEEPEAGLIFDSAWNLYGTTASGGANRVGTVFQLAPSSGGGWRETVLHSFGAVGDGSYLYNAVVLDSAGNLYGTTSAGGKSGAGLVFELTPASQGTWTESILYIFAGGPDGSFPNGQLVLDGMGNIYGATNYGGGYSGGGGTVFELKPNGNGTWSKSILHSFGSTSGDGLYPTGVVRDSAGNLYGTTFAGGNTSCSSIGITGCGIAFQLRPSSGRSWTETILHRFSGAPDGGNPQPVILDQAGNLYGTSAFGGLAALGSVFKLSSSSGTWKNQAIYWFPGGDGINPESNLIADSGGNLYGTTPGGGLYNHGAVFKLSPKPGGGWTTSLIYSFKGVPDGSGPVAPLVFDTTGNLYGTTGWGGTNAGVCATYAGCGTVFKLTPATGGKWMETVLHSFTGAPDGAYPYAGVTFSGGKLLGTTYSGGGNGTGCSFVGCGVIFEMSPTSGGRWKETVAYTFTGGKDSGEPWSGSLAADASGNVYGTTTYTGCQGCASIFPTVFELSPNGSEGWAFSSLYAFTDFAVPRGGLALDGAGNIYGTTSGDAYIYSSAGSVFELSRSGANWTRSTLYSFSGGTDGSDPIAGVTFDAAGNLYGTTLLGGDSVCGCGVVYKLTPSSASGWTFGTLYAFGGYSSDGTEPYSGVVIGAAGNLFGTTWGGGTYGVGTVYEVTP